MALLLCNRTEFFKAELLAGGGTTTITITIAAPIATATAVRKAPGEVLLLGTGMFARIVYVLVPVERVGS